MYLIKILSAISCALIVAATPVANPCPESDVAAASTLTMQGLLEPDDAEINQPGVDQGNIELQLDKAEVYPPWVLDEADGNLEPDFADVYPEWA